MIPALVLILAVVLVGPLLFPPIERNIEFFFVAGGMSAAVIAGEFGWPLMHKALTEPIAITIAVFIFGAAVHWCRPALDRGIKGLAASLSARLVCFVLIVVLGLLSSVITAVVASLVLVESIALLGLDRASEITAVVLACFAIGLGAALTPVGEPLGAIATSALGADFWYLMRLLGPLVVGGILLVAAVALLMPARRAHASHTAKIDGGIRHTAYRALRVYAFVAGLVGLSWGLRPLVDAYISRMPDGWLFWLNSVSALVDNATLTAAEIGPSLSAGQQRAILMGLLVSGGMLVPGNIPNIVAASRLGITSREWARVGLTAGLPLMVLYFLILLRLG
ncbi:MAG: DUF1646 family protein [Candidatus Binataceae bacterium]